MEDKIIFYSRYQRLVQIYLESSGEKKTRKMLKQLPIAHSFPRNLLIIFKRWQILGKAVPALQQVNLKNFKETEKSLNRISIAVIKNSTLWCTPKKSGVRHRVVGLNEIQGLNEVSRKKLARAAREKIARNI